MVQTMPVVYADAVAAQRHQQQAQRIGLHHPAHGVLQIVKMADESQLFARQFHHVRQQQRLLQAGAQRFRLAPDLFADVGIETDPAADCPHAFHRRKGRATAGLLRQRDGAEVQPLAPLESRQIVGLQKQIGAGLHHKRE